MRTTASFITFLLVAFSSASHGQTDGNADGNTDPSCSTASSGIVATTDATCDVNSSVVQETVCEDLDGDGYGWDGAASCVVANHENTVAGPCVDYDGDGWGWNGIASCTVDSTNTSIDTETAIAGVCLDDDADGWGWNGIASCTVDTANTSIDTDTAIAGVCLDDDGDGWGWNGIASCTVDVAELTNHNDPTIAGVCVDDDADGWGWNGVASCTVDVAELSNDTDPTVAGFCVDDDADGWGWDGTATCVVVTDNSAVLPESPINETSRNQTEDGQTASDQTSASPGTIDPGSIDPGSIDNGSIVEGSTGEGSDDQTAVQDAPLLDLTQTEEPALIDVDRFVNLTTKREFGNGGSYPLLKFPDGATITYKVHGTNITEASLLEVGNVFTELAALAALTFIEVQDTRADINIYFDQISNFQSIEPFYVEGNAGFFIVDFDIFHNITSAVILIDESKGQVVQNHLIREEITQSLGLLNDLYDQPDSMFYGNWSFTVAFSPSDIQMIETLYRTGLTAAMNESDIRTFFGN